MSDKTLLAEQEITYLPLYDNAQASKPSGNKNSLRVIELFAGIGSQHQALVNLGIPHEVVAISENDKWAIIGYEALHGPVNNLGDIRKIEHLPECDLITYSFPCQDLSVAGYKRGMAEDSGTRSSLLWEVGRLLDDMDQRNVLPEVLLMENVDAILNKKNIGQFTKWIQTLNDMGYISSYQVMNAKDYGVAQNRKRCFMVSTLSHGKLKFPPGFQLEKRLKDYLEDKVDESYYLSEERIAKFEEHRIRNESKGNHFGWHPLDPERERANAITTNVVRNASGNYVKIPKSADPERESGIVIAGNLNNPKRLEHHNRVYSTQGVSPTLFTPHGCDKSPKIQVAGKLGKKTQHYTVYEGGGIAPTIASCDWKDPLKVVVSKGGLSE